jgi:mRNA interferase MazF
MRPIHVVTIDKPRPAVILTRGLARPLMSKQTVAPITSTIKGLSTEVLVGVRNGLDHECAISCDGLMTVHVSRIGRQIGFLHEDQEVELSFALRRAFDLVAPEG